MTVTVDPATGCLVIDGTRIFPVVLAQPPPVAGQTPTGSDGWAEVAGAGVNFVRTRAMSWSLPQIDAQLAAERQILDAAAAHHLHCWLQLGSVANLPPPSTTPSSNEQLLVKIANG
jgi:hypothetical protein